MNEKEKVSITADEYRLLEAAIRNAINTLARNAEPKEADITKKNGIAGLIGKELNTAAGIITKLSERFFTDQP